MTSIPNETLLQAVAKRVLLGDGAMGTQLQQAGLVPGECGDAWNLQHPDRVEAIQRCYVEAGSDCLLTNTFGGSRIMLERHSLGDEAVAVNQAAVEIARKAFGEKRGFVIGDIGPFGGLLEPLGNVPAATVRDAFTEQAEALVAAGVDAVIVETQTALEELALGIEAAKKAGAPCVIGSMAYDVGADGKSCRTMMGVSPTQAATFMRDAGVDIIAMNCGSGLDIEWAAHVVAEYRTVCELPTMAQPNAGQPVVEGDQVVYKQTPEEMAAGVAKLIEAGANIIGSCCGSTPEHTRLFRQEIDRFNG